MKDRSGRFDRAEAFKARTKKFALSIIGLCRRLPKSREARIISDQLLRCGTSVGANYRAACRARSTREFYSKLCIVVEEADETVFWLEIIRDAELLNSNEVAPALSEASEILAIAASSRKTAGKRLK